MPEGDTIFRAATNLRKALDGKRVHAVTARPEVRGHDELTGEKVTGVEARGKHLMMHFENGRVVHSHMGMTGAWHIYPLGHTWYKPKSQAVLAMKTDGHDIVCFTPKQIRVMTERELQRDLYLQRLGPDLLGPPIPDDVFLRRIRSQQQVAIGEAIMNQTVVCGIGNIYKSEVLFRERIHPLIIVADLSDERLLALRDRARTLMRLNLDNGPRRTRFRGDEQKLWVYQRSGDHCLQCDSVVEMVRQGDLARSTYFCSECQRLPKKYEQTNVLGMGER